MQRTRREPAPRWAGRSVAPSGRGAGTPLPRVGQAVTGTGAVPLRLWRIRGPRPCSPCVPGASHASSADVSPGNSIRRRSSSSVSAPQSGDRHGARPSPCARLRERLEGRTGRPRNGGRPVAAQCGRACGGAVRGQLLPVREALALQKGPWMRHGGVCVWPAPLTVGTLPATPLAPTPDADDAPSGLELLSAPVNLAS